MAATSEAESDRGSGTWLRQTAENLAGWFVLAAVLALLEGPRGAVVAVGDQAVQFLHTFVGSDQQEILAVSLKTLPLMLAAAVMTFLLLRRWLPEGMGGVFVASMVVLGAGWVGNEISAGTQSNVVVLPASQAGGLSADVTSQLGPPTGPQPVKVLPENLSGVFGVVARAVNQLAGYVQAYGLNLFLAGVIVGAYVGWICHRRLARIESTVESLRPRLKRAA